MDDLAALHQRGNPFALVKLNNIGAPKMAEKLGAKAIVTSSVARCYTLGVADLGNLSRYVVPSRAKMIANATPIPLSPT